jgi:hypothetical protein
MFKMQHLNNESEQNSYIFVSSSTDLQIFRSVIVHTSIIIIQFIL